MQLLLLLLLLRARTHTHTNDFVRMVANCSPATAASLVKLRVPHFDLVQCDRIRLLPQHAETKQSLYTVRISQTL
jgi:hypothetical protein